MLFTQTFAFARFKLIIVPLRFFPQQFIQHQDERCEIGIVIIQRVVGRIGDHAVNAVAQGQNARTLAAVLPQIIHPDRQIKDEPCNIAEKAHFHIHADELVVVGVLMDTLPLRTDQAGQVPRLAAETQTAPHKRRRDLIFQRDIAVQHIAALSVHAHRLEVIEQTAVDGDDVRKAGQQDEHADEVRHPAGRFALHLLEQKAGGHRDADGADLNALQADEQEKAHHSTGQPPALFLWLRVERQQHRERPKGKGQVVNFGLVHHRAGDLAKGREQKDEFFDERPHAALCHHQQHDDAVAQTHAQQTVPDAVFAEEIQRRRRRKNADDLIKRKEKSARHGFHRSKLLDPDERGPQHGDRIGRRQHQNAFAQRLEPPHPRVEQHRRHRQRHDGHAEQVAVHKAKAARRDGPLCEIEHGGGKAQIDQFDQQFRFPFP